MSHIVPYPNRRPKPKTPEEVVEHLREEAGCLAASLQRAANGFGSENFLTHYLPAEQMEQTLRDIADESHKFRRKLAKAADAIHEWGEQQEE